MLAQARCPIEGFNSRCHSLYSFRLSLFVLKLNAVNFLDLFLGYFAMLAPEALRLNKFFIQYINYIVHQLFGFFLRHIRFIRSDLWQLNRKRKELLAL